jgi:rare lipoprotein A
MASPSKRKTQSFLSWFSVQGVTRRQHSRKNARLMKLSPTWMRPPGPTAAVAALAAHIRTGGEDRCPGTAHRMLRRLGNLNRVLYAFYDYAGVL